VHDAHVSEEIELAAKTTGEVVAALVEASGAMGPPQELWGAVATEIHYRFYPRTIKQAVRAAEKIKRSGLPERAYSEIDDRLIRDILVGAATESDENMRERWANLLANALTSGSAEVRVAFPNMLRELEPGEAAMLDKAVDRLHIEPAGPLQFRGLDVDYVAIDNLARLRLVQPQNGPVQIVEILPTALGQAFVNACRAPSPAE
jgi:hypothetical protein